MEGAGAGSARGRPLQYLAGQAMPGRDRGRAGLALVCLGAALRLADVTSAWTSGFTGPSSIVMAYHPKPVVVVVEVVRVIVVPVRAARVPTRPRIEDNHRIALRYRFDPSTYQTSNLVHHTLALLVLLELDQFQVLTEAQVEA